MFSIKAKKVCRRRDVPCKQKAAQRKANFVTRETDVVVVDAAAISVVVVVVVVVLIAVVNQQQRRGN